MRGNPLDNTLDGARGPGARLPLLIGAVSLVVLAGAGLAAHVWTVDRRMDNVERAVARAGHGAAEVAQMEGPECWRAREGYRWKTATASGWACAGPRDEVVLHVGEPDGRWP
ncbi:hypothetical protein LRS10_11535 [Phenylobacterium sp. J426]|uniref:hypothetical protein n=1 Tax=Phenylobacterium sp. J426 TaxID=2898439 RepID=UPI0021509744|nr:hypothetical protein [Phenylobacterium sp. J426]MCR5874741.1 hypothetical protein [Phenylobacterium sp. J426]